jgi:hypothetical protein
MASVDDATRAGDRWYVVDGLAHQIHVLDSTGHHLRSFGREGRGPGEFLGPTLVAANEAQVFVAEISRPAISVFDAAGTFVRHLRAPGDCTTGGVVAMSVDVTTLYVLRRCLELPRRVRYQVERSHAGEALSIWEAVGDTVQVERAGGVPMDFPVMAVGAGRLLLGDGGNACLRIVRLADGSHEGERCLHEIPRHPMPAAERERLAARTRGRMSVPDSLPRILRAMATDSHLVVQVVDGLETSSWHELPWIANQQMPARTLGRPHVRNSFYAHGSQLTAWDDTTGVRIEVLRVSR